MHGLNENETMLELHDVLIEPLERTVSLTVGDGRMVCIAARRREAGTAVLRAVMGLHAVKSGHISIDGELLTPLSAPYFRRQMAYVPGRLTLIPGQDTVGDVRRMLGGLSVNRELKLERREEDARRWADLTATEQYVELLSVAARLKRRLVLADEPWGGTDAGPEPTAEALRRLTAEGAAVLVVSHRPAVMSLADQVVEL